LAFATNKLTAETEMIEELDDLLVCLAAYQEDEADALWVAARDKKESEDNAKFDKWFFGGMKSDLL
jgi:hypothetical protein